LNKEVDLGKRGPERKRWSKGEFGHERKGKGEQSVGKSFTEDGTFLKGLKNWKSQ